MCRENKQKTIAHARIGPLRANGAVQRMFLHRETIETSRTNDDGGDGGMEKDSSDQQECAMSLHWRVNYSRS